MDATSGGELLEALGLDPARVLYARLQWTAGRPPELEAHLTVPQGGRFGLAVKRYRLVAQEAAGGPVERVPRRAAR